MPEPENKPNGIDPSPAPEPIEQPVRKSLREVAEDAYDEVIEASDEPGPGPQVDADGQPRDAQGRFATKPPAAEPGVAADGTQPPPSPEDPNKPPAQQQQDAHPAPQPGRSSEPPQNWSAADRAAFTKQTPEGQEFLLRRHSEMEGDYQRRVQANAAATEFTQSLAPIFNDPVISQSLRDNQIGAHQAITEWARMHKQAVSPDMRDRVVLWHEIGQRMGLDPAAVYGQSRSGQQPPAQLPEEVAADPAIRYFADHISQTAQQVQALRGQIVSMQQAEAARTNAEALKVTKWGIDSFASEKDAQGNPKRPDFDTVLPQIIELFQANPNRDLNDAYQQARWMHPATRERLIQAERTTVQQQASNSRARQAVRVNARGVTSPVGKPADANGSKSLRDTLENTADEIGFG